MLSQVDPSVIKATVRLKREQSRLTALRRRHLEGAYIPRAVVQEFVIALANDFRGKVLALPGRLRRIIPGPPNFELEDEFDKIVDAFLREIAEASLTVPEPVRTSTYSTRPGPRPRSRNGAFNGATKPKAAAE